MRAITAKFLIAASLLGAGFGLIADTHSGPAHTAATVIGTYSLPQDTPWGIPPGTN